jgi:hypothetical protein
VGTITRERDEPRGVLSKNSAITPEESLAKALKAKPSSNETLSTAKANLFSQEVNGAKEAIGNGEPVKRGRPGRVKKPSQYTDIDNEEEEVKPKEVEKPKKTPPSSASKVESPEKKEKGAKGGRGRKSNKAALKSEEKENEKNQIKTEIMASTASNNKKVEENSAVVSGPKKIEVEIKENNLKVGKNLLEKIENIRPEISESQLADSSSTASGVNSKRKPSFEEEIYDPSDAERYVDKKQIFFNPFTGCSSTIAIRIKGIRLEPKETDVPSILKKLKQTEKKVGKSSFLTL